MTARATPLVVLVGAGGIGHPAAVALAREPVRLRVIDDDAVEASNLHRLPWARPDELGARKVDVLARARSAAGRGGEDEYVCDRLTPSTARALLRGADVVVEGADNFATKFLVADACGLLGLPVVHGAAVGWVGTVMSVRPGASACYRCVFEDVPAGDAIDCATAGVYGPVTAVIGALMAADALRLLRGDLRCAGVVGRYEALRGAFRASRFARRADCPLCGAAPTIRELDATRYAAPICAA